MNAMIRTNVAIAGHKSGHGMMEPNHKEMMTGLHNPAWWTYLRLSSGYMPDAQFRVRFLKADGAPAFTNGSCTWTQVSGQTHYLPWAIPATLADEMGLHFEITCLETDIATFVTRVIGFHEMPHLSPYDRYLFVDGSGHIVMAWGGQFREWPEPVWGQRHRLVTPLAYGDPRSRHYYPMGWLERVDL